jgi:hypothetical protein
LRLQHHGVLRAVDRGWWIVVVMCGLAKNNSAR